MPPVAVPVPYRHRALLSQVWPAPISWYSERANPTRLAPVGAWRSNRRRPHRPRPLVSTRCCASAACIGHRNDAPVCAIGLIPRERRMLRTGRLVHIDHDGVSTPELAPVEEAVKTTLILDSVDAWLLTVLSASPKRLAGHHKSAGHGLAEQPLAKSKPRPSGKLSRLMNIELRPAVATEAERAAEVLLPSHVAQGIGSRLPLPIRLSCREPAGSSAACPARLQSCGSRRVGSSRATV